ncbi:MAG: hypothetical protein QOJ19_1504, partial [Acidimicrobiia bacterium]|nr:hypothetical protein [Acidimicrobiia bacterium]
GPRTAGASPPTAPVFTAPSSTLPPGGTTSIPGTSGATPGLYGGTQNQQSCDKQQMVSFLANNPDKGKAWADAIGIKFSQVSSYINSLTGVLLRGDTRVTNHGFKNGGPTEFQAVLQAGTAVLLDEFGVPRARCACGNPLNKPIPSATPPTYQGPPWAGFSPTNVTVVIDTTIINIITIIDVTTGVPFGRPMGPQAGPDQPLPGSSASPQPTAPQATAPRPTAPPTTAPQPQPTTPAPTSVTGVYRLVAATHSVTDPNAWTVDDRAGTARITGAGYAGDYRWTVPAQIDPAGTRIQWSCTPTGNYACAIAPTGTGVKFDTTDLAAEGRAPVTKSAVVTVTGGVAEATLVYQMGFGATATYTYRR